MRLPASAGAMAHDTGNRADVFFEYHPDVLRAQKVVCAQFADENGGAEGRVARKREFAPGCEYAQPRGIDWIMRLEQKGRLREVELGGNSQHRRGIETAAVDHDGERVAGERPVGEDVQQIIFAAQAWLPGRAL